LALNESRKRSENVFSRKVGGGNHSFGVGIGVIGTSRVVPSSVVFGVVVASAFLTTLNRPSV
jgi:hypothetical protein